MEKAIIVVRKEKNVFEYYKVQEDTIFINYRLYPISTSIEEKYILEDIDCVFGLYGDYKVTKENDYYLVTLPVKGQNLMVNIVRLILCREGIKTALKISTTVDEIEIESIYTDEKIESKDLFRDLSEKEIKKIQSSLEVVTFDKLKLYY